MNSALLIIDIQNDYFVNGTMTLAGAELAGENAKLVLNNFRNNKLPVIHIQHIATKPGTTFFLPNTNGAEINDCVKPLQNEKIIVKHYPNSFRETELLDYLKLQNINDLVICGMMTHMCIDATTRSAKDFGFNCILLSDACATRDLEFNGIKVFAENVHHAFLASLNNIYAKVITTEQFLNEK
jgi:nicotinamidase-related amidase